MDDVKLQYSKFYEYLMVAQDLPVLHGQTENKYFYMFNKKINYFVRFFGVQHNIIKDELDAYLKTHTNIFLSYYQSRMNALSSDADLVKLKSLLYSCKRVC
mmetsp:Transcript_61429/g.85456  ORF Transcript_61429/g.85456 Transcript_61429/m.85456 type:complete len:101 (-) Transcript_61429:254-556(-)